MKDLNRLIATLSVGAVLAGQAAFAAETRNVRVEIFGMGPAVDGPAYQVVRNVLGNQFTKGAVDRIDVLGYGIEGGFAVCATTARFAKPEALENLIAQLKAITPNPKTTSYRVEAVEKCER